MLEKPRYVTEQNDEAIRKRMLTSLPGDLDRSPGSFMYDALAPVAIELAQANATAQEVLRRGFALTAASDRPGEKTVELDLRAAEHGLTRRPAVRAVGTVIFTGAPGTVVPSGTRVSTASTAGRPAVLFRTTAAGTLPIAGEIAVSVEAETPGRSGNAAVGAVLFLSEATPGVTSVRNDAPIGDGLDEEDDTNLLARYLQKVRSPSAGGNKADYANWAMEVPGVGGVSVVPIRDGPGTVSIAIVSASKQPAPQVLVDTVQDHIAPPLQISLQAATLALGGYGTSLENEAGQEVVGMVYHPDGNGTLIQEVIHSGLVEPGIWQVRALMRVNDAAGTHPLVQLGVWNQSVGHWATATLSGDVSAVRTLSAADLAITYTTVIQEFAWNGVDRLELRLIRLASEQVTEVRVSSVAYRSTFSSATGEGKAPVGARVTVEPATPVQVYIGATLTTTAGYQPASVRAAVEMNLAEYMRTLAFSTDDPHVRWVRVGQVILDTPGVQDYADLLINGGTANVPVGVQEVPVLAGVSLS